MEREERLIHELLDRYGTRLRRTAKGDLYGLPAGQTILIPHESKHLSDHRGWKNSLAELKRALRASGSIEQKHDEDEETEMNTNGQTNTPAATKLRELGIHVERKHIDIDVDEAVADANSLAVVLGLADAAPGQGVKVEVEMVDSEGHAIEGPITLRVRTEVETKR